MARTQKRILKILVLGFLAISLSFLLVNFVQSQKLHPSIPFKFNLHNNIQLFCHNNTSTYNNFYQSQHFYLYFDLEIDFNKILSPDLTGIYLYVKAEEKNTQISNQGEKKEDSYVSSSVIWDKSIRVQEICTNNQYAIDKHNRLFFNFTDSRSSYPFRQIEGNFKNQQMFSISLNYEYQLIYGFVGKVKDRIIKVQLSVINVTLPKECIGQQAMGKYLV